MNTTQYLTSTRHFENEDRRATSRLLGNVTNAYRDKHEPMPHHSKFANQAEYLRSFKFFGVRDKFFRASKDPAAKGRVARTLYVAAAGIGLTAGTIHYVRESFVIYLKYQALVDGYYWHKKAVMAQQVEAAKMAITEKQTA